MKATGIALAVLLAAGGADGAGWHLAMGPNPGGKLGEDMPFQGDDVVRRAPAATAEREGRTPAPPCPPARAEQGAQPDTPEGKDCAQAAPAPQPQPTPGAPSK